MSKALTQRRGQQVSKNAPRITIITIPKDKIREVIGTGGKVIREICETTGAKIDIEDDGTHQGSPPSTAIRRSAAIDWIKSIVAEPEVGADLHGQGRQDRWTSAPSSTSSARATASCTSPSWPERVKQVTDVVKVGDEVKVKVLGFDDRGKVKLSMKTVDQTTGADLAAAS